MLLDNFYTILSSESSDSTIWTIQVKLNPGHPVYQGHFPGHPVVPGVCLLQLTSVFLQVSFGYQSYRNTAYFGGTDF